MPKDSVNLYLSIQSGSSERTVTSLTDKTRALDKETQLLKQATDALAKANKPLTEEQVRLQAQMKASQKTINELQKAYDEYGDEMMKLDLDQAIENHARLKTELSEVNAQLGANQKTYKEYLEIVRKGSLGVDGGGGDGGGNGFSALAPVNTGSASSGVSAMSLLAGLGIGDKLSSLAQDLGGAMLTSALGSEMGGLATGALSGALSGAALGSVIPGLGTAVGAVLGGALGAAQGGVRIFEARDDAFKDYYTGLYQDVSGLPGEMVESGSTIAGSREQTRIAFEQKLGGEKQAAEYLARVEKMAASTNYDYDEIVGYTKSLLNTYDAGQVLGVLQTLSDASGGLGLDSSDVSQLIQGLYMLRSSDTANLQYLKSFTTRGVDTNQAIADYLNDQAGQEKYGKNDVTKLISDGKISGEDAAQAILDYINNNYGGLSVLQSETYDAMVDNLGDITASLQALGGDTYNALRKEGIQAEMDALGGALGDAIKEINAIMGENQARRENLQDQYRREVLDAVLTGTQGALWSEFTKDQQDALTKMSQDYASQLERYRSGDTDAGEELQSLYKQAEALGQSYYDNSDEVARLNEIEREAVDAIRLNTVGLENAYTALYDLNQVMSRGLIVKGIGFSSAPTVSELDEAENTLSAWRADPDSVTGEQVAAAQIAQADAMAAARRNAFGLSRVPYDDYPALLHRDERVLTAAEARAQDAGSGQPVAITITGNSFTGTPEDMAFELAQIILQRMTEAGIAAAPK